MGNAHLQSHSDPVNAIHVILRVWYHTLEWD